MHKRTNTIDQQSSAAFTRIFHCHKTLSTIHYVSEANCLLQVKQLRFHIWLVEGLHMRESPALSLGLEASTQA